MPAATSVPRQVLVVAGSGRSGTSLFTGLTTHLGLHVPKPEVKSNRSNPRGFSEPRWAVDFHNELLAEADVLVDDGRPEAWEATELVGSQPQVQARLVDWLEEQFAQAPRIVVKDPRLAWFFQLYRTAAEATGSQLVVATMLRHPAEVLKSRELAYGTKTNHNTRAIGWVNMMLGIEHRTRDLPRATVAYADLLADWRGALATADESLGLGLLSRATPEQLAEADALVDPGLRRSVSDWDELGLRPRVRELAEATFEAHGRLVGLPAEEQDDVRRLLDELTAGFVDLYDEAWEISRHRTGGMVRRERRKAVRKALQERSTATESPSGSPDAGGAPVTSVLRRGARKAATVLKRSR